MSQKARNQGTKIWPDVSAPEGFMQGPYPSGREYANPPRPGKVRSSLGPADVGAVEHALKQGSKRITRINEGTRAGIRKRIQEAIEQGMSPAEAGAYVREWSGFDEYRAERIARTEMMFSYNEAATRSYQAMGVTQVVADDGDEDEECAERHGQVFPIEEAMTILDHPNGTLDWLPVEPSMGAEVFRQELHGQRPIPGFQGGGFQGQGQVFIPEPPVPPPPPVTLVAPARSAQAERELMLFQEGSIDRALETKELRGTFGESRAMLIHNEHGDVTQVPFNPGLGQPDVGRYLYRDNTVAWFQPNQEVPYISNVKIDEILEAGGDLRIFNVNGEWVEIRSIAGRGPKLTPDEWEAFRVARMEAIDHGADAPESWVAALQTVLRGRAQVTRGQLDMTRVRQQAQDRARIAAEQARAKLLAEEAARVKRLEAEARRASSPLRAMPRDEVEQGIRTGKIKLEDVAEQRWGWKGGTPGSGTESGKFVIRPTSRAKDNPWTPEHEAMFFRAFEDVAARVGGYDRMRVDMVRFSTKTSRTASADYGLAGHHYGGAVDGGMVKTSRVHFYKDTARELGSSTREYGTGADDFYNVAVHELGHAFDYGSVQLGAGQAEWNQLARIAIRNGRGPIKQAADQKRLASQRINVWQKRIADSKRELDMENPPGFWEGRRWLVPGEQTYREPSYYTVERYRDLIRAQIAEDQAKLDAIVDQAKALDDEIAQARAVMREHARDAAHGDYAPTNYAITGKSEREAFAECVVLYLEDPELLREIAPRMFAFVERVVQADTRYDRT